MFKEHTYLLFLIESPPFLHSNPLLPLPPDISDDNEWRIARIGSKIVSDIEPTPRNLSTWRKPSSLTSNIYQNTFIIRTWRKPSSVTPNIYQNTFIIRTWRKPSSLTPNIYQNTFIIRTWRKPSSVTPNIYQNTFIIRTASLVLIINNPYPFLTLQFL